MFELKFRRPEEATRLALLGGLSMAMALSGPCGAHADTAPTEVDEVVVTAQKRAERLEDVPMAITAASARDLVRRHIDQPADLTVVEPAFTFTQSAYGAPIYTIRGVGFFNEALGASPAVGVYVDQAPLAYSAMTEGAGLDAARVEILKGPQGTLFGQNATGGAINYIPNTPTQTPAFGAEIGLGRFDDRRLEGFASGPLSDNLTARLAISHEARDGWQRQLLTGLGGRRTNGDKDFSAARLLLDWRASDRAAFTLNLNGWRDHSDVQAKQQIAYAPLTPLSAGGYAGSALAPTLQADLAAYPNAPSDPRAAGFDPNVSLARHDDFVQAALKSEIQLRPNLLLTAISTYSDLDVDRPADVDGTPYPDNVITVVGSIRSFTQEVRLAGGGQGGLRWMVGAYAQDDAIQDVQQIDMNGTNSGFGNVRFRRLANRDHQDVTTWAGFGGLDVPLGHDLVGQVSARYTDTRHDYKGCLADPGGPDGIRFGFAALSTALSGSTTVIAPGACVTIGDNGKPVDLLRTRLDEDNLSWRAALNWTPAAATQVYAAVTKGYKSGGFDTLPAIRPAQLAPVPQESVLQAELGARTRLFDGALGLVGSVHAFDYRDKQITGYVQTGAPFGLLPALVSIPRSRGYGAEASADWSITPRLTLRASAAYLETRVRGSFVTAAPLGGLVDVRGESFPHAPKWGVSSDLSYRFPVGHLEGSIDGGATYRSRSKAAFGGGPLFVIDDYVLIDATVGIGPPDGRWRVEAWGQNLGDAHYWTTVEHVQDTVTRQTGMSRTWGVTLRVRR